MDKLKSITIDLIRTDEKSEIIYSAKKVNLKIKFFWDSHGRLVEFPGFNDKLTFSKRNVDIDIEKETFKLDGIEFEYWNLIINGEKLGNGTIYRYSLTPSNNFYVKMVVGWG